MMRDSVLATSSREVDHDEADCDGPPVSSSICAVGDGLWHSRST